MSKKWHSGPPPSVGWWPASSIRWEQPMRWWNGEIWSRPAYVRHNKMQAADIADQPAICEQSQIEWQHRPDSWPERSKK